MASHSSNDFSSPQEAIEGYLEALLQDVADYEDPEELQSGPGADNVEADPVTDAKPDLADASGWEPEPEDTGRVFSPSGSVRELSGFTTADHSPEVQAQAVSRESSAEAPLAFKEDAAVIMPDLQIAEEEITHEPDIQVSDEVQVEDISVSDVQENIFQAEPEIIVEDELEDDISLEDYGVTEDIADSSEETETELTENSGWANGKPVWAQERFECLLFNVKGLTLAVPLAELGGIHKREKDLTPLFGQPSWFLGIMRNNQMNIGMVDTAQWVMPEYINGTHSTDYRFAIHIHNSEWGLACDEVAEAISLDPEEVKWRTSLGRRPWLAGTVVGHMCALIDVAAFARLLDSDKVPVDLQSLDMDEE